MQEIERSQSSRTRSRAPRDVYANEESKIRYEAYSRLQAAAVAFGENLPVPEIVAIGGQSDGKSSLLEAFLGFRFNVREVEMGTRRPLVVQMVHDPTAKEPRCRVQNEDNAEYGQPIVPETAVAEILKKRTEEHLTSLGGLAVSSKSVCLRVEYAFCPNLTIIDTPGFILKAKAGEQSDCPDAILDMVKAYIAPPHRLILFLQQSSVEWASSLWMHVVQEVDPSFSRTIMVASKFDNRLREFKEHWEVDKYLSAVGYLPAKVRPFFVALPSDRSICTSAEWRRQIHETDQATFDYLRNSIKGTFDEERFGSHIGFASLRRFLENELARRYREAAPSTLATLQQRCDEVQAELSAASKRLVSLTDAAMLRRTAMEYAGEVVAEIAALLNGTSTLDPTVFGMTTDEERAYLGEPRWPGIKAPVRPPNASLKLYGAAAFERCLHEFQKAAEALEFPDVARDRVANVLLANRGLLNGTFAESAAQQIATGMASQLLLPLLDAACSRLSTMLRRVFDIAKLSMDSKQGGPGDVLRMYVSFHASLKGAYTLFVNRLEDTARLYVKRQLEAHTSPFSLSTVMMRLQMMDNSLAPQTLALSMPGHMSLEAPEQPPFDVTEDDDPEVGDEAAKENDGRDGSSGPVVDIGNVGTIRAGGGNGIAAYIDGSPTKGRVRKAPRTGALGTPMAGNPLFDSRRNDLYVDVVDKSSKLFAIIRQTVVCEDAPTSLKSSFLDPLNQSLFSEVFLALFACSDKSFMNMFHAEGAVKSLTAKTESLARRADGLTKCKNEFAELARCL